METSRILPKQLILESDIIGGPCKGGEACGKVSEAGARPLEQEDLGLAVDVRELVCGAAPVARHEGNLRRAVAVRAWPPPQPPPLWNLRAIVMHHVVRGRGSARTSRWIRPWQRGATTRVWGRELEIGRGDEKRIADPGLFEACVSRWGGHGV